MRRTLNKIGKWVFGIIAAVALLTEAGALIWMIWASNAAPDGSKFDATMLPSAVMWTALIVFAVSGCCCMICSINEID